MNLYNCLLKYLTSLCWMNNCYPRSRIYFFHSTVDWTFADSCLWRWWWWELWCHLSLSNRPCSFAAISRWPRTWWQNCADYLEDSKLSATGCVAIDAATAGIDCLFERKRLAMIERRLVSWWGAAGVAEAWMAAVVVASMVVSWSTKTK